MLNGSSLGWKSTYHYLASCLQVLLNDIYNDLMKALDFQLLQINDHFWNRGVAASTGSFLLEAKTMGSKDFWNSNVMNSQISKVVFYFVYLKLKLLKQFRKIL